jgi:hypothetical protein
VPEDEGSCRGGAEQDQRKQAGKEGSQTGQRRRKSDRRRSDRIIDTEDSVQVEGGREGERERGME